MNKKTITILHVIQHLGPGGRTKHILELFHGMRDGRYSFLVCCLDKKGDLSEKVEAAGIKVKDLSRREGLWGALDSIIRLVRLMKKERVHIVHTHGLLPLFYGSIAARLAGVPIVIETRHVSGPKERTGLSYRILSLLTDRFITVSQELRNIMLEKNRISPGKVIAILNGIDTIRFEPRQFEVAQKRLSLGLSKDHFIIGTISRLNPEKDLRTLIRAFSLTIKKIKALLLIVGTGPQREELEKEVEKLGLDNFVKFLGFRDDIPELLATFDVFALSSLEEGLCRGILEAMASGKAIIATAVCGNSEMVINGLNGFLVSPSDPEGLANALINLGLNRKRAEEMGEKGREIVKERFDLRKTIGGYRMVYDSMLVEKGLIGNASN